MKNLNNWVSVNDRLPESHGEYVVYTGKFAGITISYYQNKWIECGTAPIEANRSYEDWTAFVTHWTTLEAPVNE